MGIKSTLRSRMISTGLDVGVPAAPGLEEKRLSFEFRMWSRSLRSSFCAIISAAASLGQRIYGPPVSIFQLPNTSRTYNRNHPQRHNNTEEPTDDAIYHAVQLLIFCLCAVQGPVCVFLLHAQAEEVRLGDDEVEVLVVNLRNQLRRARNRCLSSKVFQQRSRNR